MTDIEKIRLKISDQTAPYHFTDAELQSFLDDEGSVGLASAAARYCKSCNYDMVVISGILEQQKLYKHLGFLPFGPVVGKGRASFQPMYSFVRDYEYAPEVGSLEELRYYKNFVPLYMASLTTRDAWGNPLHYKAEGSRFWIGSGGSDGQFAGFDQEGAYTDWQGKDIILSGDTLVYGPRMAEQ